MDSDFRVSRNWLRKVPVLLAGFRKVEIVRSKEYNLHL